MDFFRLYKVSSSAQAVTGTDSGDISDNAIFRKGDFEAVAQGHQSPNDHPAAELDRYFPWGDAEYEAKHILNGECRVVKSVWGHMPPMNPADTPAIDGALSKGGGAVHHHDHSEPQGCGPFGFSPSKTPLNGLAPVRCTAPCVGCCGALVSTPDLASMKPQAWRGMRCAT